VAEGAGAAAAEEEALFAGTEVFAAGVAGAAVLAALAELGDAFSDFAPGDGVTVFTLAFVGAPVAAVFAAAATAGCVCGGASAAGFEGC